ncbi:chloride channel protein [candidate division KSB1 bacterium]
MKPQPAASLKDRYLTKIKSQEYVFTVSIAIIIGILGGYGAILFRYLIKLVQRVSYGDWNYTMDLLSDIPWYVKVLIPAIGGLIVGPIIYFFAREAKGHGVPEVMEAVALRSGKIRPRVAFAKTMASAVSIGTGGSVGREGPIVQIGSTLGSIIGQFFKVKPSALKTFVGCGAAAGIAATFNAPIAGALFSMEIIIGNFGAAQFTPIVVSSVISTAVSRYYLGDTPAFLIPSYHLNHPLELVFYLILGIIAGYTAIVYIKTLYKIEDIFEKIKFPEYLKPVLGGLIIGSIGLLFPQILGVGYETITKALEGNLVWYMLLLLIMIKLLATSITIGSGGSGGIFAPSLFIGASLGGFIGTIVNKIVPGISAEPGAYALVGMGAMVSAATHAPITAMIIIFELTNDYKIILPLMIACTIGLLLASRIHPESIYTKKLIRKGINIFQGTEINILKTLQVKNFINEEIETVKENLTLNLFLDKVVSSIHTSFFVINDKNELTGVISLHDTRQLFYEKDALANILIVKDFSDPNVPCVTPEDDLDYVMKIFSQNIFDHLAVVDPDDHKKILGSISKTDVLDAYNKEIFRRDALEGIASHISAAEKSMHVSLMDGYSLTEMEAPTGFYNKTIKELEIRAKYGIEIILIKKPDTKKTRKKGQNNFHKIIPEANYRIEADDIFLVAGPRSKIDKLKKL